MVLLFVFQLKLSMFSNLKHDNLIELLGYCVEGNVRVLAYEFATMGSLHDILHGAEINFRSFYFPSQRVLEIL